jgi:hypothetical protein
LPRPPSSSRLGKDHPAPIQETAAMAAQRAPRLRVKLHLPARVVELGLLSNAQLDCVGLAVQANQQRLPDGSRRGFLNGDGAGVGKGARGKEEEEEEGEQRQQH